MTSATLGGSTFHFLIIAREKSTALAELFSVELEFTIDVLITCSPAQ